MWRCLSLSEFTSLNWLCHDLLQITLAYYTLRVVALVALYDCTSLQVIECLPIIVWSLSLNIFLLFSVLDRCNLPLHGFGSLEHWEHCYCQLLSRNTQNSWLLHPPWYRFQNALQYQKSCLLSANLKKQRRKANANSARIPHCSQLLCAWVCEFDGHLSNDTLQWPMHSFWKSHQRGNMAVCVS